MQKIVLSAFAFLALSASALAVDTPFGILLNSPEFSKFEASQGKQNFEIQSVTDVGVETGIRAKCPCESVRIVLRAKDRTATRECQVGLEGAFGATGVSFTVKIDESKCVTTPALVLPELEGPIVLE